MHNEYMKIARKLVKNAKALADVMEEREEFMRGKSQEELDAINEKIEKKVEDLEPEYEKALNTIMKYK